MHKAALALPVLLVSGMVYAQEPATPSTQPGPGAVQETQAGGTVRKITQRQYKEEIRTSNPKFTPEVRVYGPSESKKLVEELNFIKKSALDAKDPTFRVRTSALYSGEFGVDNFVTLRIADAAPEVDYVVETDEDGLVIEGTRPEKRRVPRVSIEDDYGRLASPVLSTRGFLDRAELVFGVSTERFDREISTSPNTTASASRFRRIGGRQADGGNGDGADTKQNRSTAFFLGVGYSVGPLVSLNAGITIIPFDNQKTLVRPMYGVSLSLNKLLNFKL